MRFGLYVLLSYEISEAKGRSHKEESERASGNTTILKREIPSLPTPTFHIPLDSTSGFDALDVAILYLSLLECPYKSMIYVLVCHLGNPRCQLSFFSISN